MKTRLVIDADRPVGDISPRIFGSFVEHLGRCVYTGIFEPDHPSADSDGLRTDVLELVKEMGVTVVRYPGGNFVSAYDWEDGVGPVQQRPARLELAWHSLEPNTFGTDEFMAWCRKAGVEPMLAVNLGTRGERDAVDLLDYVNGDAPTALAQQRRDNGHEEPYGVTLWCLGNEMDGPWQVGHKNADDYAYLATSTARAMRMVEPSLELIACGSASWEMPTFGDWERTVLDHAYDVVDFISLHRYYDPDVIADDASLVASGVDLDRFIAGMIATADHVKAKKRSDKDIMLSVDEWNVWHLASYEAQAKSFEGWPVAPPLLEDVYTGADALAVGGLLITLLRHCDRVKAACQAQLVNVIGPIMTRKGGPAWRQTTFHPFALAARLARGRAYHAVVETPLVETVRFGPVPAVDAVVTWDAETGRGSLLALNRSLTEAMPVEVDLGALPVEAVASAQLLRPDDLADVNTAEDPDRVAPVGHEVALADGRLTVELPPASWLAVELTGREG
ncbi:MAG: alpha-N-arabinofuranosidase [Propionibacteriaceae bacterium]|nr:alpha-N-arabinofuranosidase [Propionibacteriaceae bacterium]